MAKEGIDIPSLDALVLATPRSDVVQACGRILHGKTSLSPVIADVVDNWFIGKAQFKKKVRVL
jgi:superfamily II DNA or RNA helicase